MNKSTKGVVLWFTGLSGSGKSTVADSVYQILKQKDIDCERLDGDTLRENLNEQLGFTEEGRKRNIDIAGFVAKMLSNHGIIVLASFISPYKMQRQKLRKKIDNFHIVHLNAPVEVCERRDVKGLYKKARQGEIDNFTGVSHPYESPQNPDIQLNTDREEIEESVNKVIGFLQDSKYI